MREGLVECRCSILNAREEKLLDDEGCVQIRLICNHCGKVLDSETARPREVAVAPWGPREGRPASFPPPVR